MMTFMTYFNHPFCKVDFPSPWSCLFSSKKIRDHRIVSCLSLQTCGTPIVCNTWHAVAPSGYADTGTDSREWLHWLYFQARYFDSPRYMSFLEIFHHLDILLNSICSCAVLQSMQKRSTPRRTAGKDNS